MYSNLQGMLEANHFDEFSNKIYEMKNIHLCAISETWLRDKINTNKSININGFKIYRSDRIGKKGDHNKGGGVALYVRENIKCKIILKSSINNCGINHCDFIFVEIVSKFFKMCICVIYRTNKCSATDSLKLFDLIK